MAQIIECKYEIFYLIGSSFEQKSKFLQNYKEFQSHSGISLDIAIATWKVIKTFINTDIRKIKDTVSLENAFFWEFSID